MKKQMAFTLAEVLITLGIIGVVAAMTLPTLMSNTQGVQFRSQFKKTLSILNQAASVNFAMNDYDISSADTVATGTQRARHIYENSLNIKEICEGSDCSKGWSVDKTAKFGKDATTNTTIFLNDGSVISFPKTAGAVGCDTRNNYAKLTVANRKKCQGVIDVNGEHKPNKLIACDAGTSGTTCVVTPAKTVGDVYPIRMFGTTVEANSRAAEYSFSGK